MAALYSRALISAMSYLWNLSASGESQKRRSHLESTSLRKSSAPSIVSALRPWPGRSNDPASR